MSSSCRDAVHGDWRSALDRVHLIGELAYIGIICQRIQRELGEEFWMFDVLEIVLPEGAVRVPALQQNMGPVCSVGVFEEKEGLFSC